MTFNLYETWPIIVLMIRETVIGRKPDTPEPLKRS